MKGQYEIRISDDPTKLDFVGFRGRNKKCEVRDCFTIFDPLNKYRLGLVIRSHMEDTVHERFMRSGRGVLDIKKSRISYEKGGTVASNPMLRKERGLKTKAGKGTGFWGQSSGQPEIGDVRGRFPSNVILKHSPECRCEGTRVIKTRTDTRPENDAGRNNTADWRFTPTSETKRGYGGDDGKEEIPNWICNKECPVLAMGAQSGNLKGCISSGRKGENGYCGGWNSQDQEFWYGDSGGASRFFKQIQSDTELHNYLKVLVRDSS